MNGFQDNFVGEKRHTYYMIQIIQKSRKSKSFIIEFTSAMTGGPRARGKRLRTDIGNLPGWQKYSLPWLWSWCHISRFLIFPFSGLVVLVFSAFFHPIVSNYVLFCFIPWLPKVFSPSPWAAWNCPQFTDALFIFSFSFFLFLQFHFAVLLLFLHVYQSFLL